jgi:hypothetical protein
MRVAVVVIVTLRSRRICLGASAEKEKKKKKHTHNLSTVKIHPQGDGSNLLHDALIPRIPASSSCQPRSRAADPVPALSGHAAELPHRGRCRPLLLSGVPGRLAEPYPQRGPATRRRMLVSCPGPPSATLRILVPTVFSSASAPCLDHSHRRTEYIHTYVCEI